MNPRAIQRDLSVRIAIGLTNHFVITEPMLVRVSFASDGYVPTRRHAGVLSKATDSKLPCGPAQVGLAQVGLAQVGLAQVGPAQVGPAQVGPAQVGPAQVGPAQVGPAWPCVVYFISKVRQMRGVPVKFLEMRGDSVHGSPN